ncbi:MAG: ABC-F family ATP-binding cassette domain-containing protein [Planctomycetota bacterium]|jgi:ATP-binding cassette subfamily F protein uup
MLIALRDIHKAYAERELLQGVDLVINEDDRIGLVGPNGAGKSTLMKIVAGLVEADAGERQIKKGMRVGYLEQEPELDPALTIREEIRKGLGDRAVLLRELDEVHQALADASDTRRLLHRQSELEIALERCGGHDVEHRVEALADSLGLPDPDAVCGPLSGGERRRVALAQLLLGGPDLLLLDEPTNHLDAIVTEWLEDTLLGAKTSLLMVTHDRYFLDRVVDRIVEIDRGQLYGYEGGYGEYLLARADRLATERRGEETRRNLLRRETEWMRRGPPGRSTKAKARIARFHKLVDAKKETVAEPMEFAIPAGPPLGKKVVRLVDATKRFGDRMVLPRVTLEIERGERVGIVGPNGAGKTTLLKLMLGDLEPDAGRVEIGSTVRFARIDQNRDSLNPTRSVVREIGEGNTWVMVNEKQVRIEPFLDGFMFPRALFDTPIEKLSGGEKNRVLLAKLLLRGGNVLVLDEPTNDLDLQTLRVLEEALCEFEGTVLVVSHDRWFLDRVATRIVYLDDRGGIRLHPGSVSGLIERMKEERASARTRREKKGDTRKSEPRPRKLTWKEQQELAALPDRIHRAEAELEGLDAELADPGFYDKPQSHVVERTKRRTELAGEIAAFYARWEELESLS